MKTLPAGLPKLPSGLVYLGLGGTFNISSDRSARPTHGCFHPTDLKWQGPCNWDGNDKDIHYAAPADSEIVKLNTPPALDLSKLPIGTRVKYRDGTKGTYVERNISNGLFFTLPDSADPVSCAKNAHFSNGRGNLNGYLFGCDVIEVLDQPPSELEALKARVAVLEKEALEAKAKAAANAVQIKIPAKWDPTAPIPGFVYRNNSGSIRRIDRGPSTVRDVRFVRGGLVFKSQEACRSAAEYRTFFSRLLNLAAELNPSGLVGGEFSVAFDQDISGLWEVGTPEDSYQDMSWIFETKEAAQKAADILNRDGWKPPIRK